MSPRPGSIHTRPRADSGAARLWQWARERRGAWTTLAAMEACSISPRRCRAIVAALHAAGILEAQATHAGNQAAEWELSAAGRALTAAPILIVDARAGLITGVRCG